MVRCLVSAGLVVLAGFVGSAPVFASIVEALTLHDLVAHSDHVVTGTAVHSAAQFDPHGRIVTDVRVLIDQQLKGTPVSGEELIVRRLGGAIGELGMRVEGEAVLEIGQRYMLFLRDRGSHYRPTGMSQGALPIITMPDGREMVMPGAGGLQLVSRSGGRLQGSPSAVSSPTPLDEFTGSVRDVLGRPNTGRPNTGRPNTGTTPGTLNAR